jgi:hypothetical protein
MHVDIHDQIKSTDQAKVRSGMRSTIGHCAIIYMPFLAS